MQYRSILALHSFPWPKSLMGYNSKFLGISGPDRHRQARTSRIHTSEFLHGSHIPLYHLHHNAQFISIFMPSKKLLLLTILTLLEDRPFVFPGSQFPGAPLCKVSRALQTQIVN